MKKLMLLVLVILFLTSVIYAQTYSGGGGTSVNPYLIADKADLKYLSENTGEWSKHFKQTEDIVFAASDFQSGGGFYNSGNGFIPIGTFADKFLGSYDGNGHTISNLEINRPSTSNNGLFGYTGSGAEIKDLGLENVNFIGQAYTGGLAGNAQNSIITNCYATGLLNSQSVIGGLVGNNIGSTISNSYSTCSIIAANFGSYLGGFVGISTGSISDCYAIGSISGSTNIGGLLGGNGGTISNSFWNTDTISTGVYSGSASGATGKTTAEMKNAYTFLSAGWSNSIWNIGDAINDGYPYLDWQNTGGTTLLASLEPSGSGTSGDPYLITSIEDLYWLSNNSSKWGKDYKQTADITFAASDFQSGGGFYNGGSGFIPIGTSATKFEGSYNGDGHIISNLVIDRPSTSGVGFFGYIGIGSEISNLGLENVDIDGASYVGGLVGFSYTSSITECYTTGQIQSQLSIGGLVGSNASDINDCYSTCSVNGYSVASHIGGLIGINTTSGTISQSYAIGSVSGSFNVGGIVGSNGGTVTNSFWNTDIIATGIASGTTSGPTGKTTAEMKNAYTFLSAGWSNSIWNIGDAINDGYPYLNWQNTGGTTLLASLEPSGSGTSVDPYLIASIEDLYWLSNNSSEWDKDYQQTADITFTASDFQSGGGFYNGGNGFIPIGNNTTKFEGSYDGDGHIISNLEINRGSTDYIGFFGFTGSSSEISNLGLENVNIDGQTYVGGLAGSASSLTITNCFTTGQVQGKLTIGGLIGINTSDISNCYSTCTVTASGLAIIVGGLVGINQSASTISNCYATGSVSGTSDVGGILGDNSGTVSNSFWNTDTIATGVGSGGTLGTAGKTTAEMKTSATFFDAGWSNTIWYRDDGFNNGYPYFSWQNPGGTPLPVELVSFKGNITEDGVLLEWETATETNNYGFEVERQNSELGTQNSEESWETIGFVEGHGNSNSLKEYSFLDSNPMSGTVQYRLKQIDTDGKFEYSEIVEVEIDGNLPQEFTLYQNYPNPFNPSTTIKFIIPVVGDENFRSLNTQLIVYDILGREVTTLVNENLKPGNYEVNFDASNLSSGMYYYRINVDDKFNSVKKMVMVK